MDNTASPPTRSDAATQASVILIASLALPGEAVIAAVSPSTPTANPRMLLCNLAEYFGATARVAIAAQLIGGFLQRTIFQ